ncbi:hypothetical protein [Rhodococcus pyridinivorans]|uniref:hypothetical protein n=1 Tax=Rhodococcus pyridinivorans TaxID=103816 RepID=UPI003AADC594
MPEYEDSQEAQEKRLREIHRNRKAAQATQAKKRREERLRKQWEREERPRRLHRAKDMRSYLRKLHGTDHNGAIVFCSKDRAECARLMAGGMSEDEARAKTWITKTFQWPLQSRDITKYLNAEVERGHDIYLTQALSTDGSRKLAAMMPTRALTMELDREPTAEQWEHIDALGADVIASGTVGHYHLTIYLWEHVDPAYADDLARCVARALGVQGNDGGKFESNGLTRPPGSFNFKHDPPVAVRVVNDATRLWYANELRDWLDSRGLWEPKQRRAYDHAGEGSIVAEKVSERSLTDKARGLLANDTSGDRTNRWGRINALVRQFIEDGLTLGQMLYVIEGNTTATNDEEDNPQRWEPIYDKAAEAGKTVEYMLQDAINYWTDRGEKPRKPLSKGLAKVAEEMSPEMIRESPYWGEMTEDELFESDTLLSHIRDYARGQLVVPMAALTSILARVLMLIPPHVVLDNVIGDYASLNPPILAIATRSGGNKGSTDKVSMKAFSNLPPIDTRNIGSGEGIAAQYGAWDAKRMSHLASFLKQVNAAASWRKAAKCSPWRS